MKGFISILVVAVLFLTSFAFADEDGLLYAIKTADYKKEEISESIIYKGKVYMRDIAWKKFEKIVHNDINGDGKNERIMRLTGVPRDGFPRAFTIIYETSKNGWIPVKTLSGGQNPDDMEFFDITGDNIDDLILYDISPNHYTTIMIYSYKDNDYNCLFENGTACYVHKVRTDLRPVRVTIGRENWEKEGFCYANSKTESLFEVWEWSGENFVYSPKLSTTPPITEKEALEKTYKHIIINRKKKHNITEENQKLEWLIKGWIAGARLEDIMRHKK